MPRSRRDPYRARTVNGTGRTLESGRGLASRSHPRFLERMRGEDRDLSESKTAAETLVDLLDYIEQVVRLDEKIALPFGGLPPSGRIDGGNPRRGSFGAARHRRTDLPDAEAPIWLAIDRLVRMAPPDPPPDLAPWFLAPVDAVAPPVVLRERLQGVTAIERGALIAADRAAEEDFSPGSVDAAGEAETESRVRFDLRLRLNDQTGLEAKLQNWLATTWSDWAKAESIRRKTIAIYGQVYHLHQQLERGGAGERRRGRVGHRHGAVGARRPQDRTAVDRVRRSRSSSGPTAASWSARREPSRASTSPPTSRWAAATSRRSKSSREARSFARRPRTASRRFGRRASSRCWAAAATRLAAEGLYRRHEDPASDASGPVITGDWVFFARPALATRGPRRHRPLPGRGARRRCHRGAGGAARHAACRGGLDSLGAARRSPRRNRRG